MYSLPHELAPERLSAHDVAAKLRGTEEFWREWAARCTYDGPYRDAVVRSALVLKALTNGPTGAIVAAATTSLPEEVGGERNWDYRYTWLRDSALTLNALFALGYRDEAHEYMSWLKRTTAGRAKDLQIMYGVGGERFLPEVELDHLEGYRGSRPVRIGNGAYRQFQLDVFAELDGREGAVDEWRSVRDEIREVVEREGVHPDTRAFTQSFADGGKHDASNLMIPIVGFVAHDDPRARATAERIVEELSADGFVYRYLTDGVDGLSGDEATFAICSFWLVECLARAGETERARELFERLLGFCNDIGLLAEEIDPHSGELVGNFPQAWAATADSATDAAPSHFRDGGCHPDPAHRDVADGAGRSVGDESGSG